MSNGHPYWSLSLTLSERKKNYNLVCHRCVCGDSHPQWGLSSIDVIREISGHLNRVCHQPSLSLAFSERKPSSMGSVISAFAETAILIEVRHHHVRRDKRLSLMRSIIRVFWEIINGHLQWGRSHWGLLSMWSGRWVAILNEVCHQWRLLSSMSFMDVVREMSGRSQMGLSPSVFWEKENLHQNSLMWSANPGIQKAILNKVYHRHFHGDSHPWWGMFW